MNLKQSKQNCIYYILNAGGGGWGFPEFLKVFEYIQTFLASLFDALKSLYPNPLFLQARIPQALI